MEGGLYQVVLYEHQKLGRGTATIKIKAKNLKSGGIKEISFISGARVEEAPITSKEAQYLYKNQNFFFMDPKTYEQFELSGEKIGEAAAYLKEGIIVKVSFYEGEPLSVELPIKMEFKIKETGPGVKGDSATNIWKQAVLDNGFKIKVPLFIEEGDLIEVDTRTGEYLARTNK